MKNQHVGISVFISVAFVLAATTLSGASIPAATNLTEDRGDYYRMGDGTEVHLRRSLEDTMIAYTVGSDLDVMAKALGESGVATVSMKQENQSALVVKAIGDVQGASAKIALLPSVRYVRPVFFEPTSGLKLIPLDEVIIAFRESPSDIAVSEMENRYGIQFKSLLAPTAPDTLIFTVSPDVDPMPLSLAITAEAGIRWAQPNFLLELRHCFKPSDTFIDLQQSLNNTGQSGAKSGSDARLFAAWDLVQGNKNLVIAIIDTGVQASHPDLMSFINDGESGDGRESNGIDDDGNGYVDDYRGWNFFDNNNDSNPDAGVVGSAHGTQCAGIAAAIGNNNLGIAGAAFKCSILSVKVARDSGHFASSARMAASIRYAATIADIISISWSSLPDNGISSAIAFAGSQGRSGKGTPVFVSTGNGASEVANEENPSFWKRSKRIGRRAIAKTRASGMGVLTPRHQNTKRSRP